MMMRITQKLNLAIVAKNLQALKHKYPANPNIIIQTITPPRFQIVELEAMGRHRL
jgi:hypothetical protein